jgi:uncharacterized protein (UPF0305 family)
MDNYTLKQLEDLIKHYMNLDKEQSLPNNIKKQITRFVLNDEMSYKEIGRAVCYYVECKKRQIDSLYGISFVSNIRADANNYFSKLEEKQKHKEEEAKKFKTEDDKMVFNIKEIIKSNKPNKLKQLSFDDIDLKGDEHGR